MVLVTLILAACNKIYATQSGAMGSPASQFNSEIALAWFKLQLQLAKEAPGFSPPVASRAFAYAGVALYEAIVPGMPTHQSLAGQLNGLTTAPQHEANAGYHWPTVANSALASIVKRLYANAPPWEIAAITSLEEQYNRQFRARLCSRSRYFPKNFSRSLNKFFARDSKAAPCRSGPTTRCFFTMPQTQTPSSRHNTFSSVGISTRFLFCS
jgi:hypothetical protein